MRAGTLPCGPARPGHPTRPCRRTRRRGDAAAASAAPTRLRPGPAQPSAVGQFFGRALRGDWAGAAQAALWPVGFLLVSAFAFAVPSYGQDSDDVVVGFTDRMRIALAALLQGVGGGLEVSGAASSSDSSLYDGGYEAGTSGTASISLVPLLVTVLWIVLLVVGVRMLRGRLYARVVPGAPDGATAGLEAAVRVALLVTGATLLLALIAQPGIEGVDLSTTPFLTALWTLLLTLAVAGGVLHADDLRYRVAEARPGVRMTVRAFGTAVRAMGWVLLIAAVLGYLGLALFGEDGGNSAADVADSSEFDGSAAAALGAFLMLLPNLALGVLGLSWGAPLQMEARGTSSFGGGGYERESFGLSRLGDELGSGAVAYALALGLVCALTAGVLIARRSLDRREQLLSAGLFFGLFLLLAGVGGLGVDYTGGFDFFGSSSSGSGQVDVGLSVPDALLFGLLWIGGAAFVGPYLAQVAGAGTGAGTGMPPMPPTPGQVPGQAPGQAAAYSGQLPPPGDRFTPYQPPPADRFQQPHEQQPQQPQHPHQPPSPYDPHPVDPHTVDPHTVHLTPPAGPPPRSKRRVGIWVGTLAGAFVIGGGAAAGVLLLQDDGDGGKDDGEGGRPVAAQTTKPSAGTSPTPTPSASPDAASDPASASASAEPTDMPDIPAGYHQVFDEKGFSFAVPEQWDRQGIENDSQITYAGSTGQEHFLVGVIPAADYTSYDNFLAMEKHLQADKKKSGYQRLRLERNTFQGRTGALWEYTYENEAGQTIHGIDQAYIAADGTEYAILLSAREDVWGRSQQMHRVALDTWRLTDTD
ncbi:hypothetical protein V2W30_16890 [Streptomyces sp. Q6]|uniref:Uncharacterized protein n=1 Tax=Streptomyces citrinus TaxID=3118173 RepID=A0ACD5ACK3_9ACTN